MTTAAPDVALAFTGDPTPLPPGPRSPALIQMLRFRLRPIALWDECARRYGDCFTLRFPGTPPFVFFTDPDAIKGIFTGDPDTLAAGEVNAYFAFLLGERSLLTLDGAAHLRDRRLLLPPFHGERMTAYGGLMRAVTDRVLDALPLGEPLPAQRAMQAITLDVILRAVFGLDDAAEQDRVRACLLRYLALTSGRFAPFLVVPGLRIDLGPWSPWGRFRRERAAVDRVLLDAIARRRAAGTAGRADVLSLLLDARDEQGQALTDDELRDEMLTLLMAGHETTATALAWVIHRVLAHPAVEDRLRAEVAAASADDAGDVSRLVYLDAVVKETMRLSPIIHQVTRKLRAPAVIAGRALPAGVIVAPAIYLTHRRADLWPEPERFHPERFVGVRPSPYAFFPFGGGVRRCIGAAFASYEMKIILAQVFSRLTLRPVAGPAVRPVALTATVGPSGGTPIVVEARRPATARGR